MCIAIDGVIIRYYSNINPYLIINEATSYHVAEATSTM